VKQERLLRRLGLFAYQINWQTVLFVGYATTASRTDGYLQRADAWCREDSYAFQR